MKALFWTAVINGVVAVPVLVVMRRMGGSSKVMGAFAVGTRLKVLGWVTTLIMAAAAIGMFATIVSELAVGTPRRYARRVMQAPLRSSACP